VVLTVERDIAQRGRTVVDVLAQYNRFVKPAYDDFIRPTMKHADVIIPFSTKNDKAVEMLIQNLNIKVRLIKQAIEGDQARARTFSECIATTPEPLRKHHENGYLTESQVNNLLLTSGKL